MAQGDSCVCQPSVASVASAFRCSGNNWEEQQGKVLLSCQCEHGVCNLPGKVAFLKTTTARCCPQNPTSPPLKCHPVAMKLLSLGVVVSEGQVCTQPTALLHSTWGLRDSQTCSRACLCVPTVVVLPGEVSQGVTCSVVPFIPFPPSSLSLCLHGCSWGHVPSSFGATEPPPSFLHHMGGCLPLCAASGSSFPRLPQGSSRTGALPWDISCVPSPGASIAPLSQPLPPCTRAVHATGLGSV